MLRQHTPVWVWDGYWWPAIVVTPDLETEMILVRFENGVTAPVKASDIRKRHAARGASARILRNHEVPRRRNGVRTKAIGIDTASERSM